MRARNSAWLPGLVLLCALLHAPPASALPSWLAELNVALPPGPGQSGSDASMPMQGGEPVVAIVLRMQTMITVEPSGKLLRRQRSIIQILRPDGVRYGTTQVVDGPARHVVFLRGWRQTREGGQIESKMEDIVDTSPQALMVSDQHLKTLRMQGTMAGSIVAFDVEQEFDSSRWIDDWRFQDLVPVRQARLLLQLPADWTYRASWLNHSPVAPIAHGPGRWEWALENVPGIEPEGFMPALQGIVGRAALSISPTADRLADHWSDVGSWYGEVTKGRRASSPEIKQRVTELTATSPAILTKMQVLTEFVQQNIRYFAIELGIGAYQPQPAAEVLSRGYGDCKDKVTLLSAMLQEIGVESYYVLVNSARGVITDTSPPEFGFNHVILAIRLPDGVEDESFGALVRHPKLGRLLIFDPTNPFVPLGSLSGSLQDGYGLLVAPDAGELIQLPRLAGRANAINRSATMSLDDDGTLRGEVHESWAGDAAAKQRAGHRSADQTADQIQSVEARIAPSFANLQILKAVADDLQRIENPVTWSYSLRAAGYAKVADNLLIVRPRILGSKTSKFLETGRPRELPIELACPEEDTDQFEIKLPSGYVSDYLPSPVDADYPFGSYHSKTELVGSVLRYSRVFTIRKSFIPAEQAEDLRQFYRLIDTDERASAVLKRATP